MTSVLIAYCIFAAVITVGFAVAILLLRLHRGRRRRRDAELSRLYLRIVVHALLGDEEMAPRFPHLHCVGGRLVLAETLARLATTTYGLDPRAVQSIVEAAGLEEYLLRRARRTRGYRRAWFLLLLSRLPVTPAACDAVARFAHDKNRSVRFYVLMVRLAAAPAAALRLVAEYADPLSAFELCEIMAVLRRGQLSVAYGALLASSDRNLCRLGMSIVQQFGVEESEALLLHIVAKSRSPELSREALYTLCALQRPVAHPEVARRLSFMTSSERKALLRYMALEGYAGSSVKGLFGSEEPYFEALLNSYKRTIVWS